MTKTDFSQAIIIWCVTLELVSIFIGWTGTSNTYRFTTIKEQVTVSEVKAEDTSMTAPETPQTVEEEIIEYITKVFGKDARMALAVSRCESSLNPNAINKNNYLYGGKGIDHGLFQVNSYWHRFKGDIANLTWKENVRMAKDIFDASGWNAWYCYRNGGYLKFL